MKSQGSQIRQAMIMAAGLGTRMKPFSEFIPKPFLPVMGIPVVQYGLEMLSHYSIDQVIANYHHLPENTRALWKGLQEKGYSVHLSDESNLLLGSAGGLRKALPHFNETAFFILNADAICPVNLERLANRHLCLKRQWDVTLTLAVRKNNIHKESYTEIVYDAKSGIIKRLEAPNQNTPFYTGIGVVEPSVLEHLPVDRPSDFVKEVLLPQIEQNKVGVFETEGDWLDIGSPLGLMNAHVELLKKLEIGNLWPIWRSLIEKTNRRISSCCWVTEQTPPQVVKSIEFWGPAYLSGKKLLPTARSLGPRGVAYGEFSVLRNAISIEGVSCESNPSSLRV